MVEMFFGINGIINENEKKNVIVNYILLDIIEVCICEMFSMCGFVVGVKFMWDKSGVSFGYVFVNYNSGFEVIRVIEVFDGK